jgi:hypothetical protein
MGDGDWWTVLEPDDEDAPGSLPRLYDEYRSDLFHCQRCKSFWLLPRHADRSGTSPQTASGHGCETCGSAADLLPAVKAYLVQSGQSEKVSSPQQDLPTSRQDLTLPGDYAHRADLGADFVVALLADGPHAAVAKSIASEASAFVRTEIDRTLPPADYNAGLKAIADGLDKMSSVASQGIQWVATNLIGVPEFYAKVIGKVAATTLLNPLPLTEISTGIRVVGTVFSAAHNCLDRCAVARDLPVRPFETVVEGFFLNIGPPSAPSPPEPPDPFRRL